MSITWKHILSERRLLMLRLSAGKDRALDVPLSHDALQDLQKELQRQDVTAG